MKLFIRCFFGSVIVFIGCKSSTESPTNESKEYKTKYYSLQLPVSWQIIKPSNIDAHSITQFVSDKDTITAEVSCYASNLAEYDPEILPKSVENKVDSDAIKTNYVIFVKDEEIKKGIDIDRYRKQNVVYVEKTNRYKVKLITPRKSGIGIMGMYCDSLGIDSTIGTLKMNMHGKNLSHKTERELERVIEGIIFLK